MTANNKADVLVKEDGSTEVLIVADGQKTTRQRSTLKSRRRIQLAAIVLLLLLCCGGVVFTVMIVKYKSQSNHLRDVHNLKYRLNGQVGRCGTQMMPEQNAEILEMDGTVSVIDGAWGVSAVKVDGEDGPICIIRNENNSPTSQHFSLPSNEVLEKTIFNKSKNVEPMSVVVSNSMWSINYEIQPKPASELIVKVCGPDAVYYGAKLAGDVEYSGDFYTNDGVIDDEDINEELMERERRGVSEEEESNDEERPLPARSTLEGESDHDRNCCNACTNSYYFCTRLCFQPEDHVYSRNYVPCVFGCFLMMPCSWWEYRANGQV